MNHLSCPTSIVNAPVEVVWRLLMCPEKWGDFYDLRITAVDPAGPGAVGQTVYAEAGPRFLHLKVQFRFLKIDGLTYRLGLDGRFPLGLTVREDLTCVRVRQDRCRVNYNCDFGFPAGWRGALLHFLLRRGVDAGPLDSLTRLRQAAEQIYAEQQRL